MLTMTEKEYQAVHPDFRSVWNTEREDIKGWKEMRAQYMGKRTLLHRGSLLIEGMSLNIIKDGE